MSRATVTEPEAVAREARLHYVTDDRPGLRRKPWGRGFTYLTPDGDHLADEEVRERIEALAIPPAYTDVWICLDPRGHLQATGRDDRGRKQYIYHPRWREARERHKFDHMVAFGEALPDIRRRVARDLRRDDLDRERVLAAVVRLLERTLVRVGNDSYARENGSYGLTTIRKKHVEIDGSEVVFDFRGKSGEDWHVAFDDARVADVVRRCSELPGYELFKYLDADGERHDVGSDDVNGYLHEITGQDITAKDFRTWAGTVLAAVALREFEAAASESEAKKNVVAAIKRVAEKLGNTPAVCRQSYVHPAVIDSYLDGALGTVFEHAGNGKLRDDLRELQPEEVAVWSFLRARLEAAG